MSETAMRLVTRPRTPVVTSQVLAENPQTAPCPERGAARVGGRRWRQGLVSSCPVSVTAWARLFDLAACSGVGNGFLAMPGGSGAVASAPSGATVIFTLQAKNLSTNTITLANVERVSLPGQPAPRLLHYAVIPGLATLEDAKGWPPPAIGGPGPGNSWPLVPLRGYVVRAHHFVSMVVGVSGRRAGSLYLMGGWWASYREAGLSVRSLLPMVDMVCVDTVSRAPRDECDSSHDVAVLESAMAYVAKLSG